MRSGRRAARFANTRLLLIETLLALQALLLPCPVAGAAGPDNPKLVVFLNPHNNDGSPGNALVDQSIRATLASNSSQRIEVYNEYLDVSHPLDARQQQLQIDYLREKYAGRKVDLVVAGLSSGLDFALQHREVLFPGVPIVYCAVDQREVKARKLPSDVIGVPMTFDLTATLELALRLHPRTRSVVVIAGSEKMDAYWEAEARRVFQAYEGRLEFVYLTGLPLEELVRQVAYLPEQSLIYYLHVLQDGAGRALVPAHVLEQLAQTANAPIYGHVDTYVGRGVVGGRVFSWTTEGRNAARLGLRILAGEKPETIAVPDSSENAYLFDWRQLRRWSIHEDSLPPGSVVRYKEASLWNLYKWPIIGTIFLCVIVALLIVGLLVQRSNRRRAEEGLRESQHELRVLTGRLLQAQETERRRIARELHDDLSQSLALLSVELDLLGQKPPGSVALFGGRVQELSAQVKQLSSSVHDLSHQLHPAKLGQLGLAAAVRNLSKELAQSHGLTIASTHHEVPAAIPEDTALCLYRIVQEALSNVIRHSGAQHAEVRLSGSANAICLRIVDDGAGFDPQLVQAKGGLGLVSMRERLRLVNGVLAIDSQPSGGTRIDVRVPLSAPSQPESALATVAASIG
jgi:signal transduction histidine kinase